MVRGRTYRITVTAGFRESTPAGHLTVTGNGSGYRESAGLGWRVNAGVGHPIITGVGSTSMDSGRGHRDFMVIPIVMGIRIINGDRRSSASSTARHHAARMSDGIRLR